MKTQLKTIQTFKKHNPNFNWQHFMAWGKEAFNILIGNELHVKTKKHTKAQSKHLQAYQRLFRLTQDHNKAEALFLAGYHSAIQIAGLAKREFVKEVAPLFSSNGVSSEAQAESIHKAAVSKKSQAVLTYTNLVQQNEKHYKNARFANLSPNGSGLANLPSYNELFGNADFCACESCRSIFSPAAYFVDLMRMQAKYITSSDTTKTTFDLKTRRPDLWDVELSCENTNTEVSKLEIVNEVLGKHVATTEGKSLLETLSTKKYPWSLPFDYPQHQIRESLNHQQTSLSQVWKGFNTKNKTAIQYQQLGISQGEWELLSTPIPITDKDTLATYYGITTLSTNCKELENVDVFLAQTDLTRLELDELLEQDLSDAEKKDTVDLRKYFFINRTQAEVDQGVLPVTIKIIDKEDDTLQNLSIAKLDRINRFVRLAKAIGWSFTELDWALRTAAHALTNLPAETDPQPFINSDSLPYLVWIKQAQQQLNYSIYEACGIFGPLKNVGLKNGPSFFEQVFSNSNIPNPPNWVRQTLWNVPDLGQKKPLTPQQNQIQTALAAALKISQDDLVLLANCVIASNPTIFAENDLKYSLSSENLSLLYRLSNVPRVTGLSIAYLTYLFNYDGKLASNFIEGELLSDSLGKYFSQITTRSGATVRQGFIELQEFSTWLSTTHFTPDHLLYVLTGKSQAEDAQNQILGEDTISNFLISMKSAVSGLLLTKERFIETFHGLITTDNLKKEASELYTKLKESVPTCIDATYGIVQAIPQEEELTNWVNSIFIYFVRSQDFNGISLVEGSTLSVWTNLADNNFITVSSSDPKQGEVEALAFDSTKLSTKFSKLGYSADQIDQVQAVLNEIKSKTINVRKKMVQLTLEVLNHDQQKQEQTFTQRLASLYGISHQNVPLLLQRVKLTLLAVLNLKDSNTSNLQLLQRYAQLVQHLLISPAELQSIEDHPEYYVSSEDDILPDGQLFSMAKIKTFVTEKKLITAFKDSQNHFINYLDYVNPNLPVLEPKTPSLDEVATKLSAITQWDEEQIKYLINVLWPSTTKSSKKSTETTYPHYGTVEGVAQLKAYFDTAKMLDIDILQVEALEKLNVANDATKYQDYELVGNTLWAGVQQDGTVETIAAITNKLNGAKRDALVPLVIDKIKDTNLSTARDLYEYLLIDVEVEGIVQSSRVKEAISAVQLYVYRCLNNLEPGKPTIDTDLIDWWPWVEHYRTWQENREVFLYPENYIQPQLRKNKSPQFAELESNLQQTDLSQPDSVKQVFNKYMDGFIEVDNIEIIGSASNDTVEDIIGEGDNNTHLKSITRELCLVGRTKSKPHSYYYLTAKFLALETNNEGTVTLGDFESIKWDYWKPISCHLQPIEDVSPVFAFNNWYLFWVEKQQTKKSESPQEDKYTYYIRYSSLDFNGNWRATRTFKEIERESTASATDDFYASLSISMLHSIKQINIVYIIDGTTKTAKTFWFSPIKSVLQPHFTVPFAAKTFLDLETPQYVSTETSENSYYQKRFIYDSEALPIVLDSHLVISLWFKIRALPEADTSAVILSSNSGTEASQAIISVNPNGTVKVKNKNLPETVIPNQWNHVFCNFNELSTIKEVNITTLMGITSVVSETPVGNEFSLLDIGENIYAMTSIRLNKDDGYLSVFKNVNGYMTNVAELKDNAGDVEINDQRASFCWLGNQLYMGYENSHKDASDKFRIGKIEVNTLDSGPKMTLVRYPSWPVKYRPALAKAAHNNYINAVYVKDSGDINILVNALDTDSDSSNEMYYQRHHGLFNSEYLKSTSPVTYLYVHNSNENAANVMAWAYDGKLHVGVSQTGTLGDDYDRITAMNRIHKIDSNTTPVFIYKKNDLRVVWRQSNRLFSAKVTYTTSKVFTDHIVIKDVVELGISSAQPLSVLNSDGTTSFAWKVDSSNLVKFGDLDDFGSEVYFNGKAHKIISDKVEIAHVHLGYNNGDIFDGEMQEVLIFENHPTHQEIANLYSNSKDLLTRNFNIGKSKSRMFDSNTVEFRPIDNQPNWSTVENEGAKYLVYPYKIDDDNVLMNAVRLNSTATQSLSEQLLQQGIEGLLTIETQNSDEIPFDNLQPIKNSFSEGNWPSSTIDFSNGPMGKYYWEVFFHLPFLVANQLQTELQFAEAKKWYEYIFNPSIIANDEALAPGDIDANDQFWRVKGLRSSNNNLLSIELNNSLIQNYKEDLGNKEQLYNYHTDPFDPHAIAGLRPIAYQKTMVMHYVDNLIAWGDSLFKQYTAEDINLAEMLYIMAYDLLGKQSRTVTSPPLPEEKSLTEILDSNKRQLDNIHEFLVNIESSNTSSNAIVLKDNPANYIPGDYFGIPENESFMGYWDTIKERLYDIRNGLNIKGRFQRLPLFQPEINPEVLVAQIGWGQNAKTLLNPVLSTIPYYRFSTMVQKAKEVTSVVIQFGNALANALEKKDGAALNLLYNVNQQHIQALTRTIKMDALSQSESTVKALSAGLKSVENRLEYYTQLISKSWNLAELAQVALSGVGIRSQLLAMGTRPGIAVTAALPNIFGLSNGGFNWAKSLEQATKILEETAAVSHSSAGLAGVIGSFERRSEEWNFQKEQAEYDINQATNQLIGAQYQEQMAKQDIKILDKTIAQDQKVEKFLKNKFSNEQLYDWMVGKLAALYFQAYQLANNLSVQAQHAWAFEKGITIDGTEGFQPFIQNGHWDNLHHGLLAGEALQMDLQRMEVAFMKQDQRRLEITKTIAFSDLKGDNSNALEELRAKGSCAFQFKKEDFDADYDGHYCRQIKSVSISIPAVLGPYQNIHATLTQTSSEVNQKSNGESTIKDFRNNQQIAISHGMNDNGLFQLNFNDPRYLPFEGTGAISTWDLNIPLDKNKAMTQNRDGASPLTLSEVILEIKYTALN